MEERQLTLLDSYNKNMANDPNIIIATRRHPRILEKLDVWKQIHDSYLGGQSYREAGYLHKHPKEGQKSYDARKLRASYLNQISPMTNLLSGFLFYPPPVRKNTDKVDYLFRQRGTNLPLDLFVRNIAVHSLLFTCVVLVDSPKFDPEIVTTERQRQDMGLNPYCLLYLPFSVRDFNFDEFGTLNWIILDDSYYDNSDVYEIGKTVTRYTLWTKEYSQTFIINENVDTAQFGELQKTGVFTIPGYANSKGIIAEETIPHHLGEVPCRFVNWQDTDGDNIAESVMEDPAYLSQSIYNILSLMDEMLYIGTLRVLFYPSTTGELPAAMQVGGIGSLSAIPFDGTIGTPFFDNAKLDNVEAYLSAMEFYMAEILRKIGMDTDQAKEFVQSGKAKKLDLLKIKTLLLSGAHSMQSLERWICNTALAWEKKSSTEEVEITYNTDYEAADLESQLVSLTRYLYWPFEKLRKMVYKVMAQKGLGGNITQKEMEELLKEIDSTNITEVAKVGVDGLVAKEKAQRQDLSAKNGEETKDDAQQKEVVIK